MKRVLTTVFFIMVAMVFTSCDLFSSEPDRVITQGEIAGDWTWVCSEGWAYGEISIDSYGNFTRTLQGSGITPLDEEDWITDTGRMTVAGGNITIVYDGYDEGYTYKIKQSAIYKQRWLVNPNNDGYAYMAFGVDCHGSMMFGTATW